METYGAQDVRAKLDAIYPHRMFLPLWERTFLADVSDQFIHDDVSDKQWVIIQRIYDKLVHDGRIKEDNR